MLPMQSFIKTFLAALALLAGLSAQAAAPTLSELEFTRYFAERARQALPETSLVEKAPLHLQAKSPKTGEQQIFLGNSYARYSSGIDTLERVVEARLDAMRQAESLLAVQGAETVMAVLKPRDYLQTVAQQLRQAGLGDKPMNLLYRELNADILVFYVFDQPSGVRMLTTPDLKTLKLEPEDLHQLALGNLRRYFERKPPSVKRLEPSPGTRLYLFSVDDFYESSLLLLPEFWRQPQGMQLQGEPVVFVPARHLLLVAGAADPASVALGTRLAQRGYRELGYGISPRGYRLDGGQWQAALP